MKAERLDAGMCTKLSVSMRQEIEKIAALEDRSYSNVLRILIREALAERRKRR